MDILQKNGENNNNNTLKVGAIFAKFGIALQLLTTYEKYTILQYLYLLLL